MFPESTIVEVTAENITEHPGAICFINPKHESYGHKIEWMRGRFNEGLRIRLLYLAGEKGPVGYVEYIPAERCWRPVNAANYMFIHCLWTNRKKYQHQGLGKALLDTVEADAAGMNGIAVVTSDKAFMATKEIFLKHGYDVIEESGKDQLLAKQFRNCEKPKMNDRNAALANYREGMTMLYSCQCPWVARFIDEVQPVLKEKNLEANIIEIESAEEAQKAPSLYGVFNLIWNGKILADRYISLTRLKNILKKEVGV